MNAAPRRRIVDAGVLLAGDAAGVADPQSGEGIRQAVESGLLAAQTIVEAHRHFSRDRLEPYAAMPGGAVCKDLRSLARSHASCPTASRPSWPGALLEVPTFVKRVVLDQWFLHRHRLALGT